MSVIGFDADQDCSHVAAMARVKGASFVARYFKNLTLKEAMALSAAGLQILSIWETTAQRATSGAAGGRMDAAFAVMDAEKLGQPAGSAIVATVDFDASPDQVMDYLTEFSAGLGVYKMMVYANGAVCQACLDAGKADYTWLAGGMGMQGTRAFAASGVATIIQDVGDKRGLNLGIDIDSDVAASADFGGWTLGTIPAPAPVHAPPTLKALQAFLGVPADGVFGPATQAAIDACVNA